MMMVPLRAGKPSDRDVQKRPWEQQRPCQQRVQRAGSKQDF